LTDKPQQVPTRRWIFDNLRPCQRLFDDELSEQSSGPVVERADSLLLNYGVTLKTLETLLEVPISLIHQPQKEDPD
jgi:hypothetical protein